MSEAPKPEQPQELDWVQISQAMATASPDVLERMRAALAEREEENPTVGVVLELDRRARAIRQALPGLNHDHAQALLAQEGAQARMAYSELAQAVADAISAVGWSKAQPTLQRIQLLMGQPWGLNVFRAGAKRADAADLDDLMGAFDRLASDSTDRQVALLVGEIREKTGASLDEEVVAGHPFTYGDLGLWFQVGDYLREWEPQLWRRAGPALWRKAAWIFRRCRDDPDRRGPYELLRPQPKEQPRPPRPKSPLEQMGGISEGDLAHRYRDWLLRRSGMAPDGVGLPSIMRGPYL